MDRDPRARAGGVPAVAPHPAASRRAPRAGARYACAHLLQVRGRLSRGLAQAQHGRRAGLLLQGGRRPGADYGDRRRTVGKRARHGLRIFRNRPRGLHGEGVVSPEALPAHHHGELRRRGVRESDGPHPVRPPRARRGSDVERLTGHRHLGGRGDRRHERGAQEVQSRVGPELRADAPDRDRARGARAAGAGG